MRLCSLSQMFFREWSICFEIIAFSLLWSTCTYVCVYTHTHTHIKASSRFHSPSVWLPQPHSASAPVLVRPGLLLKWIDKWHTQKISLRRGRISGCAWLTHEGDKDLHTQLWEIISKSPQWTVSDFYNNLVKSHKNKLERKTSVKEEKNLQDGWD